MEIFGKKYQERIDALDWRKGQSEERACCICGKQCKGGPDQHWVFLSNMSEVIREEEGNGIDDLALHRVGPACIRKVKRAGLPYYVGQWPEVIQPS